MQVDAIRRGILRKLAEPHQQLAPHHPTTCRMARKRICLTSIANNWLWVGMNFHIVDIFTVTHGTQAGTLSPTAMVGHFYIALSLTNIPAGFMTSFCIIDRISRKHSLFALGSMLSSLIAGALFSGAFNRSLWHVYAFGITVGMWDGLSSAAWMVIFAHPYGTAHLGKITGFAQSLLLALGTSLGPPLFGFVRDVTGDYKPVLGFIGVCSLVSGFSLLFVPNPSKVLARPFDGPGDGNGLDVPPAVVGKKSYKVDQGEEEAIPVLPTQDRI